MNLKFHDGSVTKDVPLDSIKKIPNVVVDMNNDTAIERYIDDDSDDHLTPHEQDDSSDDGLYQDDDHFDANHDSSKNKHNNDHAQTSAPVSFDSVQYDVHGRLINQEGSLFMTVCALFSSAGCLLVVNESIEMFMNFFFFCVTAALFLACTRRTATKGHNNWRTQ